MILAPMVGYRNDVATKINTDNAADARRPEHLVGFRAVYVFDVAQTEGEDLPEFDHDISGEVGGHRDRLIDFLAQPNIVLEFNERIAPVLGVSYGGKIALLPGQTMAEGHTRIPSGAANQRERAVVVIKEAAGKRIREQRVEEIEPGVDQFQVSIAFDDGSTLFVALTVTPVIPSVEVRLDFSLMADGEGVQLDYPDLLLRQQKPKSTREVSE
jgi:hypothetical protein